MKPKTFDWSLNIPTLVGIITLIFCAAGVYYHIQDRLDEIDRAVTEADRQVDVGKAALKIADLRENDDAADRRGHVDPQGTLGMRGIHVKARLCLGDLPEDAPAALIVRGALESEVEAARRPPQ